LLCIGWDDIMDKYLIANILVWMAIIALGAVLWNRSRPGRFGVRHIFIALGAIFLWGLITGYPPYMVHGIPLNRGGLLAYLVKLIIWVPIFRFIHKRKWVYVTPFRIALAAGVMFCIGFIGGQWPGYYFPGYSGRVVDMDTGKPIKDAVVKFEIVYAGGFSPGGPVSDILRTVYLVTGEDGRYSVGPSLDILVLGWARYVEISAMHILTAETRKEIDPPPMTWPVHEDIQLMSVKKELEILKAKRGLPSGIDAMWTSEFALVIKNLRQAGVPAPIIKQYFAEYLRVRFAVFGSQDKYVHELKQVEMSFE